MDLGTKLGTDFGIKLGMDLGIEYGIKLGGVRVRKAKIYKKS